MTDAGTLVLTTSEHFAADHCTWRTIAVTALALALMHATVAQASTLDITLELLVALDLALSLAAATFLPHHFTTLKSIAHQATLTSTVRTQHQLSSVTCVNLVWNAVYFKVLFSFLYSVFKFI